MKLIADCGGTKVEWCLIDNKNVYCRFKTPGMNAMMLTADEMTVRIKEEVAPNLEGYIDKINDVYFYGAGCVSAKVCDSVRDAIHANIPAEHIEVASDMLGASRALSGDEPGIVCILGTGSNSCYYNGVIIEENVSPLGYILGDEGSGAYLGKILVGDVLKRQLPKDVCEKFLEKYDLDAVKVVENVYRKPYANKYLASFTPFLKENIFIPEVRDLVVNAFKAFFHRNVLLYHRNYIVHFCGSIAKHFSDELHKAAFLYGYRVGKILDNPTDALIAYHQNR